MNGTEKIGIEIDAITKVENSRLVACEICRTMASPQNLINHWLKQNFNDLFLIAYNIILPKSSRPTIIDDDFVKYKICNANVSKRKLARHILRLHPKYLADKITELNAFDEYLDAFVKVLRTKFVFIKVHDGLTLSNPDNNLINFAS